MTAVILASQSAARAQILAGAGVAFEKVSAGVDEDLTKARLLEAGETPAVIAAALAQESIAKHVSGKNILRVIFIPGRILNIIAR